MKLNYQIVGRRAGDIVKVRADQKLANEELGWKAEVAPTGSGQRPGKFDAPATNNETSADFPVMRCAEVMLIWSICNI